MADLAGVVVALLAVGASAALRPRLGKDHRLAVALALPGVPLATTAAVLVAAGHGAIASPLLCGVVVCLAGAWLFWPTARHRWAAFERSFRAYERAGAARSARGRGSVR